MNKSVFAIALIILAVCAYPAICAADGIGSLVEVGKSMDEAKKELAAETARFNSIKSAVKSGALQKGLPRQDVFSRYGEPVVMNEDLATKRERWVYKPASSSFFKGPRIYLFYTTNGTLDDIKELSD